MKKPLIVGAGLAGLLAAHAWPQLGLVERAPAPRAMHNALLRFRSDAVARLIGIEFRKVRVHKGIWHAGNFAQPNIRIANLYAAKCLGRIVGDRSIWNVDAVDRYVAPETLYEQLVETVGPRVAWGAGADVAALSAEGAPLISTAPLPATAAAFGLHPKLVFERAPIVVERYRVPGADVHQTVYFPDADTTLYRASITGSLLIVESVVSDVGNFDLERRHREHLVARAFAITRSVDRIDSVEQTFGKIAPIPDATRKGLLFALTHEHGVYSLGRFATWRNILLDDVVADIDVIKRLMRASPYELKHAVQS